MTKKTAEPYLFRLEVPRGLWTSKEWPLIMKRAVEKHLRETKAIGPRAKLDMKIVRLYRKPT